jgi:fucose 4-O-acetylase-like acetyltransferase
MDANLLNASWTRPPATVTTARPAGRVVVLDVMKGLAICLVVLGHVTQGLQHMNIVTPDSVLAAIDDFVYRFHMHAFFFAAGAVLALHRPTGFAALVGQRLRTLYYPHVLWGAVFYFIAVVFVRYFNSPIEDPGNVGRHVMEILTGQQSWFLVTLLVATVLVYPIMQWNVALAVLFTVVLALIALQTDVQVLGYLFRLSVFLVIGYASVARIVALGERLHPSIAALGAAALFAILALCPEHPAIAAWLLPLYRFVLGLIGTAGLCALSFAVASLAWPRSFFAAAGFASLAIFLLHSIVTGAARVVLLRIAPSLSAGIATALLTLAGILAPLLAYYLVKRLRWDWLFAWPGLKRHGS